MSFPFRMRIDETFVYPVKDPRQSLKVVRRMAPQLRFNDNPRLLQRVRAGRSFSFQEGRRHARCYVARYPQDCSNIKSYTIWDCISASIVLAVGYVKRQYDAEQNTHDP
jgi:hypothetical protein